MFRKLVKNGELEIDGRTYTACVTSSSAPLAGRGATAARCCSTAADRIIVDDDSLANLESKVARLAPATIYSRLLAARPTVDAA